MIAALVTCEVLLMKSKDMPARYVRGNLVDLLSWDNIYPQLRTITVLHKHTKVTRFELIGPI